MSRQLPFAANSSLLFTEVDLLERGDAGKADGFEAVFCLASNGTEIDNVTEFEGPAVSGEEAPTAISLLD